MGHYSEAAQRMVRTESPYHASLHPCEYKSAKEFAVAVLRDLDMIPEVIER